MAEKLLNGVKVAILVTDDFEEPELVEPRKALDEAGAETLIIAPHDGTVQAFRHDVKAGTYKVDRKLGGVRPVDFDAVLLPGGALNADALRVDANAQTFVKEIDGAGKPIAVICHGSWLLVSAGLVKGRHLTSYHTIQDDIRNAGGKWEDSETVRDRNWVSSRSPKDLPAFNREIINLFSEIKAKARRAA
ncbi:MAG TPA: type 1 glutamine amidotransferase domain-containing protein [Syntrophorhabdales bacterium]|nr:type 1 glutamine amidotransferase domain-containing protein [Syntrophorhabdales bacterium]